MTRINAFLRGEAAVLVLLLLALLAQTPHTASVFHRLAPETSTQLLAWAHAWTYAVALETATLVFVVRGQRPLAWGFALVSVAVNAAYYWRPGMQPSQLLAAALVSVALPSAIAFYSHDVARTAHEHAHADTQPTRKRTSARNDARTQDAQPERAQKVHKRAQSTQSPSVQERRTHIARMLASGAHVDVQALAQQWGVHVSTVRRDVQHARKQRDVSRETLVHVNGRVRA